MIEFGKDSSAKYSHATVNFIHSISSICDVPLFLRIHSRWCGATIVCKQRLCTYETYFAVIGGMRNPDIPWDRTVFNQCHMRYINKCLQFRRSKSSWLWNNPSTDIIKWLCTGKGRDLYQALRQVTISVHGRWVGGK